MRIFLLRHGFSQWQESRGDDWDSALTPIGVEQARCFARWLETDLVRVAGLRTSPMVRARETAEPVAAAVGLEAALDPDLREADFHVASELSSRAHPFAFEGRQKRSEAYCLLKKRAECALRRAVRNVEEIGGPVLLVSHGGLLKTMLRVIVGSDRMSFRIFNVGLTEIEWRRGRWHLVHLNRLDHLPERLRTM